MKRNRSNSPDSKPVLSPVAATPVSEWVAQHAGQIRPNGRVLDLAAGKGRHSLLLARQGYDVLAVDRNADDLAEIAPTPNIATLCADLESGSWPLGTQRFDAIVVVNYLHRPLFPHIVAALNNGGILIYDTFASGNERFGRPSNPDYLLQAGELLTACATLDVLAYEHGECSEPSPAVRQSICARKRTTSPT